MEPPQPVGRFLGCQQSLAAMTMLKWENPRYKWMATNPWKKESPFLLGPDENVPKDPKNVVKVSVMKYDMSSFLEQCIDRYVEFAGSKIVGNTKPANTPFLDESQAEFDENDIIAKIKAARTASSDAQSPMCKAALSQGGGMLAHIASAVLMKNFVRC